MPLFFQENTLQVILATDTDKMFVLFLYEDIQWGNVGTSRTIIGFNAGDGVRAFTLPLSLSGSLETILAAEETSNMNIPGTYAFRVDQENIAEPAIGMLSVIKASLGWPAQRRLCTLMNIIR